MLLGLSLLYAASITAQVVLVVTELSPPYQTLENGIAGGLATQKVKKIIDEAGLTPEIRVYPWARSYELAKSTPGTLIYSIARTNDREDYFDWIAPVARFRLAFMSLADKEIEIKGKGDLFKYSISAQREDIAHRWLIYQGLMETENYLLCSDILCSWDLLLKGNVDLVIDDPLLAETTLKSIGKDPKLVKVIAPIPSLDVVGYLAMSKGGEPDLLHRLRGAAIKLEQSQ